MKRAAFFDLDKTLISVNSGVLWAKHERREGNIGTVPFLRALGWMFLYHLSIADMDKAFAEALSHYKGQDEGALDARTRAFFHDLVKPHLRADAKASIEHHRAAGHELVILTSASCYEAAAAAEEWDIPHWLANSFPVDARGRLSGTVSLPLCYGPGKVDHAEAFAEKHGIDLDNSYFYSDSLTDLPMLARVGHPRVVTPDPRLRREAKRRQWPILEWT